MNNRFGLVLTSHVHKHVIHVRKHALSGSTASSTPTQSSWDVLPATQTVALQPTASGASCYTMRAIGLVCPIYPGMKANMAGAFPNRTKNELPSPPLLMRPNRQKCQLGSDAASQPPGGVRSRKARQVLVRGTQGGGAQRISSPNSAPDPGGLFALRSRYIGWILQFDEVVSCLHHRQTHHLQDAGTDCLRQYA